MKVCHQETRPPYEGPWQESRDQRRQNNINTWLKLVGTGLKWSPPVSHVRVSCRKSQNLPTREKQHYREDLWRVVSLGFRPFDLIPSQLFVYHTHSQARYKNTLAGGVSILTVAKARINKNGNFPCCGVYLLFLFFLSFAQHAQPLSSWSLVP